MRIDRNWKKSVFFLHLAVENRIIDKRAFGPERMSHELQIVGRYCNTCRRDYVAGRCGNVSGRGYHATDFGCVRSGEDGSTGFFHGGHANLGRSVDFAHQ